MACGARGARKCGYAELSEEAVGRFDVGDSMLQNGGGGRDFERTLTSGKTKPVPSDTVGFFLSKTTFAKGVVEEHRTDSKVQTATRRKDTFHDDEGGGGGGDGGGVWAPCRVARAASLICTWGPPTAYSLPSSRRCSARLRLSTRL